MSLAARRAALRPLVVPSGPTGAVIEGDYRYLLWRALDSGADGGTVLWVMLNPSIADEVDPDPTLTRCIGFSRSWGFGQLEVVNLFAAIATDPKALDRFDDPVGPKNDVYIRAAAARATRIVCAWGAHPGTEPARRAAEVRQLLLHPTWCLGVNGGGTPKHPLYLAASTPLSLYTMEAR